MFSIQDFLIYIGEPEAKRPKYSMIASGILATLQSVYKIHVLPNTQVSTIYLDSTLSVYLEDSPINSITSVTYDGNVVEYSYDRLSRTLTVTSPLTDLTIPVVLTYEVGYITIPYDLKMAIYSHIQYLHYKSENNTDNISKVVNSSGNTTFFRDNYIPDASRIVYDFYSNRQVVV
jgi:hypothetical protein